MNRKPTPPSFPSLPSRGRTIRATVVAIARLLSINVPFSDIHRIRWMNAMSSQTRKYELKARAEKQAETRRRIVEATSALHEEVGPARTTVAEIARRAGVQRVTVYNNFPDETELFAACGDHWLAENPQPDLSEALAIGDPSERLGAVLRSLYRWYRKTAQANEHLQRDRLVLPALDAVMKTRMDHQLNDLAS